jgi:hypothetical protein
LFAALDSGSQIAVVFRQEAIALFLLYPCPMHQQR